MTQYEIVNFANIETPTFQDNKRNGKRYVDYGDDNLFPQKLQYYSNKSTTHSQCLKLLNLAIAGEGYTTTNDLSNQFLDGLDYETSNSTLLEKMACDLALFNGYALEVIFNFKGELSEVHHLPFENIRAGHPDRYGNVKTYYYNDCWEDNANYSKPIPAFDAKLKEKYPKQLLYMTLPNTVSKVYAVPSYASAVNYIATEFELSKFYYSCADNSFLPSSLITIIGNPSDEDKAKLKRSFDKNYTGSENSGKYIFSFVNSIEEKLVIEPISIDNVVEHYITTSDQCKQQIITANGILSPSLIAVNDGNQSIFSNGDELKTSWDIFYNTTVRNYQKLIEKGMNLVLKYKGIPNAGYKIKPFNLITLDNANMEDEEPIQRYN